MGIATFLKLFFQVKRYRIYKVVPRSPVSASQCQSVPVSASQLQIVIAIYCQLQLVTHTHS